VHFENVAQVGYRHQGIIVRSETNVRVRNGVSGIIVVNANAFAKILHADTLNREGFHLLYSKGLDKVIRMNPKKILPVLAGRINRIRF
jgi:hypothetical protein